MPSSPPFEAQTERDAAMARKRDVPLSLQSVEAQAGRAASSEDSGVDMASPPTSGFLPLTQGIHIPLPPRPSGGHIPSSSATAPPAAVPPHTPLSAACKSLHEQLCDTFLRYGQKRRARQQATLCRLEAVRAHFARMRRERGVLEAQRDEAVGLVGRLVEALAGAEGEVVGLREEMERVERRERGLVVGWRVREAELAALRRENGVLGRRVLRGQVGGVQVLRGVEGGVVGEDHGEGVPSIVFEEPPVGTVGCCEGVWKGDGVDDLRMMMMKKQRLNVVDIVSSSTSSGSPTLSTASNTSTDSSGSTIPFSAYSFRESTSPSSEDSMPSFDGRCFTNVSRANRASKLGQGDGESSIVLRLASGEANDVITAMHDIKRGMLGHVVETHAKMESLQNETRELFSGFKELLEEKVRWDDPEFARRTVELVDAAEECRREVLEREHHLLALKESVTTLLGRWEDVGARTFVDWVGDHMELGLGGDEGGGQQGKCGLCKTYRNLCFKIVMNGGTQCVKRHCRLVDKRLAELIQHTLRSGSEEGNMPMTMVQTDGANDDGGIGSRDKETLDSTDRIDAGTIKALTLANEELLARIQNLQHHNATADQEVCTLKNNLAACKTKLTDCRARLHAAKSENEGLHYKLKGGNMGMSMGEPFTVKSPAQRRNLHPTFEVEIAPDAGGRCVLQRQGRRVSVGVGGLSRAVAALSLNDGVSPGSGPPSSASSGSGLGFLDDVLDMEGLEKCVDAVGINLHAHPVNRSSSSQYVCPSVAGVPRFSMAQRRTPVEESESSESGASFKGKDKVASDNLMGLMGPDVSRNGLSREEVMALRKEIAEKGNALAKVKKAIKLHGESTLEESSHLNPTPEEVEDMIRLVEILRYITNKPKHGSLRLRIDTSGIHPNTDSGTVLETGGEGGGSGPGGPPPRAPPSPGPRPKSPPPTPLIQVKKHGTQLGSSEAGPSNYGQPGLGHSYQLHPSRPAPLKQKGQGQRNTTSGSHLSLDPHLQYFHQFNFMAKQHPYQQERQVGTPSVRRDTSHVFSKCPYEDRGFFHPFPCCITTPTGVTASSPSLEQSPVGGLGHGAGSPPLPLTSDNLARAAARVVTVGELIGRIDGVGEVGVSEEGPGEKAVAETAKVEDRDEWSLHCVDGSHGDDDAEDKDGGAGAGDGCESSEYGEFASGGDMVDVDFR